MPQPDVSDVHVSSALTSISVAYIQDEANFIADKVFPIVPVNHQTDAYFIFNQDDFFRDEARLRADATESAGSGFNLTTATYSAKVWALHKDLGYQMRSNADPGLDIDVAAARFVTQKLLIRRDRYFVSTYLATSLWGTDVTGAASGNGTTTATYWNDDLSDPFTDLQTGMTTILTNTGMAPNTLVLGYPVYAALRKHPLIIDRIKYTSPTYAGNITEQLIAEAFDVDRVIVSKAVYNSAPEGATGSYSMIMGKNALLMYVAPSPALWTPSAGYTFAWSGFTGLNDLGIRVSEIPMPTLGNGTIRVEGEMAFDMKLVGSNLGYYFSAIVQ